MSVQMYQKRANVQLSTNFHSSEFDCKCDTCDSTLIDPELIARLEHTRLSLGAVPLRINSGFRCAAYQSELRARGYETSLGTSQHQLGRAADIMCEPLTGAELEKAAKEAGFESIGVGGSWCHVDLRPGYRRWEYKQR